MLENASANVKTMTNTKNTFNFLNSMGRYIYEIIRFLKVTIY